MAGDNTSLARHLHAVADGLAALPALAVDDVVAQVAAVIRAAGEVARAQAYFDSAKGQRVPAVAEDARYRLSVSQVELDRALAAAERVLAG